MRLQARMTAKPLLVCALALAAVLGLCLATPLVPPAQALRSSETEVTVPNVRGKSLAEAQKIMRAAGFDSFQIFDVDTDKRGLANVVKDQLPAAGREVRVSAIIKLTVYRYNP